MPNFLHYYWATNIYKITIWDSTFVNGDGPNWSLMEQQVCSPVSPASLLCAPLPLAVGAHMDNLIVRNTLCKQTQFCKHFGLTQTLVNIPLTLNPLFKPSLIDTAFQIWSGKGLRCVEDLFTDELSGIFDHFVKQFILPWSHFLRYLQIRDFTRKHFPSFPSKPPASPLDVSLNLNHHQPGCVSYLYSNIHKMEYHSLHHMKVRWEEDLKVSEDTGQRAIRRVHASSICIRHGLLQFRVINRCTSVKPNSPGYTVPSKTIGTARPIPLFLLYTENIWV